MRLAANYGTIRVMGERRKIPYGVMNWAKLVRECLFVDSHVHNVK